MQARDLYDVLIFRGVSIVHAACFMRGVSKHVTWIHWAAQSKTFKLMWIPCSHKRSKHQNGARGALNTWRWTCFRPKSSNSSICNDSIDFSTFFIWSAYFYCWLRAGPRNGRWAGRASLIVIYRSYIKHMWQGINSAIDVCEQLPYMALSINDVCARIDHNWPWNHCNQRCLDDLFPSSTTHAKCGITNSHRCLDNLLHLKRLGSAYSRVYKNSKIHKATKV